MICVVIKGPTFIEAGQQIAKALTCADLVEIRLDYFPAIDPMALKELRSRFSIPMIFTLRSQQQGGHYPHSEEQRLAEIEKLAELKPEYFDIESDVSHSFIKALTTRYPNLKLILSYHNFTHTPHDLEEIYQKIQSIPAYFYKIATMAQNANDAMRLTCWAKSKPNHVIAVSMGSAGQFNRVIQDRVTYAALDHREESAPGQFTASTLIEQYRYRSLNANTKLYGLIGDPVDRSISDKTHNALLEAFGLKAVYLKIPVTPLELADFLKWAKKLPFQGLSVTMPLKESIITLLDDVDAKAADIQAVNTLVFENGKIKGYNTDAMGALNAIERHTAVKGKQIVILGAGGAAKAIAYEAQLRGGIPTILNRDPAKAHQMAQRLGYKSDGIECIASYAQEGYDILINCTPTHPIPSQYILPTALVMDIVTKPKITPFLADALQKGCQVVYGYQMFIEQALGQFELWFPDQIDIEKSRTILEKEAASCLRV